MANNNITLAIPGQPNWGVWWTFEVGLSEFQLDIVGFLAVLGEGSILANAQVSALSRLFYLPRLLPAPQALIRTTRPTTLPPFPAKVTGVHSGNVKDHIHHVAHILLGEDMNTFTVRCVKVTKKAESFHPPTRIDTFFRGVSRSMTRSMTRSPEIGTPSVKAKANGPLSWVTLLGFFMSVSIFALSIIFGDGMSMIATILLSFLSTVVGVSNKWNLKLPRRPQAEAPPGDVVIRYPNGSYLIVQCDEDVARELYFAPEEIDYTIKSPMAYRILSLFGTLMLMLGVIALANAKLQLQMVWAGAYILINIVHWVVAAVPQKMHWDLSCYDVREQGVEGGPSNPSFTEALWKAILITKSKSWVKNGKAAPETEVWDAWLDKAEEQANMYQTHIGELEKPLWLDGDLSKATIFDAPHKDQWDAKSAWDALNRARQSEQQQARDAALRRRPKTSASSEESSESDDISKVRPIVSEQPQRS